MLTSCRNLLCAQGCVNEQGSQKEPQIPTATASVSGFPVAPSQISWQSMSVKLLTRQDTNVWQEAVGAHILSCNLLCAQGCMDKQGSQERATNSNGDHICERLPCGPQPCPVTDLVCEALDLVQHLPHVWDHICSVCDYTLQAHSTGSDAACRAS